MDARCLARMGAALGLEPDEPDEPVAENLRDLRELQTARSALIKERGRLRNRRLVLTSALLRRQTKARLALVERQLGELDAEIARRIAEDRTSVRKRDILSSIPGIGPIAAAAILTFLPEIGTLGRKQAGSLAGLVPHSKESGRSKGKSFHQRRAQTAARCALHARSGGDAVQPGSQGQVPAAA